MTEGVEMGNNPEFGAPTRRGFLLLSLAALAGCTTTGGNDLVAELPSPVWPENQPRSTPPVVKVAPKPVAKPHPKPEPMQIGGVIPRSKWAKAAPDYSDMEPMTRIQFITVHHDGLPAFAGTDQSVCAARIEMIRNSHTAGRKFADIGYHYIVDRSGRIWEGRPLKYQGAHVKDRNPGNIGVLCLGNFDAQIPTDAQFGALCSHVSRLMKQYKVPNNRVFTHKTWPGAHTACPGANLNARFLRAKDHGHLT